MVTWQDSKEAHTACCNLKFFSNAWEHTGSEWRHAIKCMGDTSSHPIVCCQQATSSTSSSGKALAASMPKTMARGLASVRPRWMTVKDAPTIPCLSPASCGTPCIPLPGALGFLMSSPGPFAPQPTLSIHTPLIREAPSNWPGGCTPLNFF